MSLLLKQQNNFMIYLLFLHLHIVIMYMREKIDWMNTEDRDGSYKNKLTQGLAGNSLFILWQIEWRTDIYFCCYSTFSTPPLPKAPLY